MNGCSDHQAQPQSSNYSRSNLDGPSSVVPNSLVQTKTIPCWRVPTRWGLQHFSADTTPLSDVFFSLMCYWHHVVKSNFSSRLLSSMRTAPSRAMCRRCTGVWCTAAELGTDWCSAKKQRPRPCPL
ncbi:hypothetical protein PpBr36_08544, partial [Pyricularia pennisetigena]|uniref:hypothetical protein n=1 Tax=Pyricularia pennisetigena TaxID=1578925 RepID=UPI001154F853